MKALCLSIKVCLFLNVCLFFTWSIFETILFPRYDSSFKIFT